MKFRPEDLILFADENLLVLNKPAGMTTEGENASNRVGLSDIIQKLHPQAMMVHRIDRETSGIVIAALHSEAYSYLSSLFAKKKITKKYCALCEGIHHFENKEIALPISKKSKRGMIDFHEGKKSLTIVNTLEIFHKYTWIEAQPLSGRFHQVRVHLSALGAPLVGDSLYGGHPFYLSAVKRKYHVGKYTPELPVLDRAALHAVSLQFEYPQGKDFYIQAPLPKDLRVALELLRKWNTRI